MERKLLNIYADDRNKPTIVLTYTLCDDEISHKKYVSGYSLWVRNDMFERLDILNYANMFLHEAFIYKVNRKKILEKDIYKAYQVLFADKLWENYKVTKEVYQNDKIAIMKKPYRNFTLFTQETMQQMADKKMIQYAQEAQKI